MRISVSTLLYEAERQTVADTEKRQIDPQIFLQLLIQFPEGHCVGALIAGVKHLAVPQSVVEGDDAAAPHQHQALLIVLIVVHLVGINEGEIKGAGLALVDEPLQGGGGSVDVDVDLVCHAVLLPEGLACGEKGFSKSLQGETEGSSLPTVCNGHVEPRQAVAALILKSRKEEI